MSRVSKSYGQVRAVRSIDLTIAAGETVALLGPNGAGKTTTIDMMLGLTRPDAGTVSVFGRTPEAAVRAGWVGGMLQTGSLLEHLKVRELVSLMASYYPHPLAVADVLRLTGTEEFAGQLTTKLSGGQTQRVRFAAALIGDPDLLVLDEPTAGIDVAGRHEFWQAMREVAGRGKTVLFATHYLEEADAYADRIVLIRKGEIVADGTSAQVKSLASGRTVRATLPGATEQALRAVPGADSIEIRGETVLIHSGDADKVARYLLTETGAHDLEITSRGLEEAFLALTGDDNTTGGNR